MFAFRKHSFIFICHKKIGQIVLALCTQLIFKVTKTTHALTALPFFFIETAEQTFNDHKHELMSFIHFEELLQKYFDHFTVVPKIAFVDVDLSALNEFLMRDRPGECENNYVTISWCYAIYFTYFFHFSRETKKSHWIELWIAVSGRGFFA